MKEQQGWVQEKSHNSETIVQPKWTITWSKRTATGEKNLSGLRNRKETGPIGLEHRSEEQQQDRKARNDVHISVCVIGYAGDALHHPREKEGKNLEGGGVEFVLRTPKCDNSEG